MVSPHQQVIKKLLPKSVADFRRIGDTGDRKTRKQTQNFTPKHITRKVKKK